MSYEPKPLIEEHYHIQELIRGQNKRAEDRSYHRDKQKEKDERDNLIKEAKVVVVIDFWCEDCSKDFKSMAIKQFEVDWSNPSQNIAFYKTKCDCGNWCIRLVTDKHKDAFWTKSKQLAYERGRHYADTIQPHETNFNLLYGRKNK